MGRDTPLGKMKNHVEGKRKKQNKKKKEKKEALWFGPLDFLGILWSLLRFSVLFFMTRTFGFLAVLSENVPPSPPPHLCAHILFLAYFGVPDAGRDGVWIPAQTNADRTSAVTG